MAAINDDDWVYPKHHKNQQYIVELMNFVDEKEGAEQYPRDTTFEKDHLLKLKPSDVRKYLMKKAFGVSNPGEDAAPTEQRAGSLRKAKQAISYFMPNKGVPWIDGRGGNPTRHSSITKAIKTVERLETKGLGRPPNDKRACNNAEFNMVLELFREEQDWDHKIKYPTMTLWQKHLIHRLDDTCHFKVNAPHGNVRFPFALKTRTNWSKNVTTMRQCPDQIILAANEWRTCTILNFAVHLEGWLQRYPTSVCLFTNDDRPKKGPKNIKARYKSRIKRTCWVKHRFTRLRDVTGDDATRGLGSHSSRKHSTTVASRRGGADQQVEYRGRWVGEKGQRVVRKSYITTDDPYTDAYVAGLLCDGGPIKCELRDGIVVTDNWLYVDCVPNVRQRFPQDHRMCRTLGLAISWAAFDPEASSLLDPVDADMIRSNFQNLHGNMEQNPVSKIPLRVLKVNDSLDIVSVEQANNIADNGAPVPAVATGAVEGNHALASAVTAQGHQEVMGMLQRIERDVGQQLEAIRGEQTAFRTWSVEQFSKMSRNMRQCGGTIGPALARGDPERINRNRRQAAAEATQHTRQPQPQQQAVPRPREPPRQQVPAPLVPTTIRDRRAGVNPHAKLASNLHTLLEFWDECVFGIGENTPAKDFKSNDINGQGKAFKNKCSRRMKTWRIQSYLINCGCRIEAANAKIVRIYGTDRPSPIIDIVSRDNKNPNYMWIGAQRFRPGMIVNPN